MGSAGDKTPALLQTPLKKHWHKGQKDEMRLSWCPGCGVCDNFVLQWEELRLQNQKVLGLSDSFAAN